MNRVGCVHSIENEKIDQQFDVIDWLHTMNKFIQVVAVHWWSRLRDAWKTKRKSKKSSKKAERKNKSDTNESNDECNLNGVSFIYLFRGGSCICRLWYV